MLNLRGSSPESQHLRLVILNACNTNDAAACFSDSGIPHVLCASTAIRDSWSQLFLHELYFRLFQGDTVMMAFQAARVALCSSPEIPDFAADAFRLMPDN